MIPIQTPENLKFGPNDLEPTQKLKSYCSRWSRNEYMECFETFFKEKDLNFMNTIS
jgi:hypothetical protein